MAAAKTIKFGETLLLLGGTLIGDPFVTPCGFTSLGLSVNIEINTTNIPDCSDPDLPAWLAADEVSKQMVLTGEGVIDTDAWKVWNAWVLAGGARYVRWFLDLTGANGGGYFQAPALLSTFEQTGERGQRWTGSIGLTMDGKPTWTAAA